MWKDIGLSDWYFDSDSKFDMDRLTAAVLELANDPQGCKRAKKAQNYVNSLNQKCVGQVRRNITTFSIWKMDAHDHPLFPETMT